MGVAWPSTKAPNSWSKCVSSIAESELHGSVWQNRRLQTTVFQALIFLGLLRVALSLVKFFVMKYLFVFFLFVFFSCGKKTQHPAVTEQSEAIEPSAPKASSDTGSTNQPAPVQPVPPDYDTTQWAEIVRLDSTIQLDLRYATGNNFVHEKMYDCPRCFLRPDVAKAVVVVHKNLKKRGLALKMYDCYRPRPIQWKLWNRVPDPRYVADPRKGSMHNRGMAVDLTIVDSLGNELDMGTDFDFFGKEAYHSYAGHSDEVQENRQLLLEMMEDHGFRSTSTEWWHYSYKPKTFPLDDWLWKCEVKAGN